MTAIRLGIVADLLEEGWTSMDLVADMLAAHLRPPHVNGIEATVLRPALGNDVLAPLARLAGVDRYVSRFWRYPQWLRGHAAPFDMFHVVDHSYAHLVHVLPPDRTIVTCHDVDAFVRLTPGSWRPARLRPRLRRGGPLAGSSRSRLPLALVRRIHSGLRRAAVVTCPSETTRRDLIDLDLVAADRIVVVPNGVHPGLTARVDTRDIEFVQQFLGNGGTVDILHVGSCIPRKRIDRLLAIVGELHKRDARIRLIKAGGTLTEEQRVAASALGFADSIVQLPRLTTGQLAALYRLAGVVVVTSDTEGFGLPVVEALACGTPVVATDIAVFREVGGDVVRLCDGGDIHAWCDTVLDVLARPVNPADRQKFASHAARFSWSAHAQQMATIYARLLGRSAAGSAAA